MSVVDSFPPHGAALRASEAPLEQSFQTDVPARLDRLPWSKWHWLVVTALGITWILDGLEVTLVGSVSGVLQDANSLHFSAEDIGLLGSFYIAGAVIGSLFFGLLTDKLGRKKLFTVTLGLYLVSAGLTAFSWNFWSFAVFRFLTGAGIGGEYSAINSAIDELIPARVRGWADLAINGTYWVGAALGAVATLFILDTRYFAIDTGWRIGFGAGAVLGLVILVGRKWVPESPRWLMTHGYKDEAERIVTEIEGDVLTGENEIQDNSKLSRITIHPKQKFGIGVVARTMFHKYRSRSLLGLSLMVSQAFLYNAILFTYALVLTRFYGVPADRTGLYLLPFALGNFLGPIALGKLFDSVGRKIMISTTYGLSAVLMAATGYLFLRGHLTATSQTVLWSIIFFFASAAASSAYLTVSEIFPLEIRGLAIALFFSIGTAVGGVVAPWLFGTLIGTGDRANLFYGYLLAAALLACTVGVVLKYGVKAERTSLEDIAAPLSSEADREGTAPHGAS